MSDTIILEARNLSKHFGGLHAVDGVSLQVRAGAFHSVIGPNGAGKTTLFNLLSGVFHPTGGQILFRGREITRLPAFRRSQLGIGRSFQITNIFPNLTVLENVRIAAQSRGHDSLRLLRDHRHFTRYIERAHEVLALVGLADKAPMLAASLPHGDKRKLEIGILLATEPEILLLDEVLAVGDMDFQKKCYKVINTFKNEGVTMVYVSHDMDSVKKYCDRTLLLRKGEQVIIGDSADVIDKYESLSPQEENPAMEGLPCIPRV